MTNLDSILKSRHYFGNKGPSNQGYGFSNGHVWMWELDCEESWVLKNWCFWTVVLEKTLESPLGCKKIQPVHPKEDQSWVFIGRTDVEAETPILWPPDAKSWLTWKDPDTGKDWRREEKGTTENEMVGWHHQLNGHGFECTLGVGDGQGGLVCWGAWGRKESDMTERLSWIELNTCFWTSWAWNTETVQYCTVKYTEAPPLVVDARTWPCVPDNELSHGIGRVNVKLCPNLWPIFLLCFLSILLDLWELLIYFEYKLIVGFIGCKFLCHLHDYSKLFIF